MAIGPSLLAEAQPPDGRVARQARDKRSGRRPPGTPRALALTDAREENTMTAPVAWPSDLTGEVGAHQALRAADRGET